MPSFDEPFEELEAPFEQSGNISAVGNSSSSSEMNGSSSSCGGCNFSFSLSDDHVCCEYSLAGLVSAFDDCGNPLGVSASVTNHLGQTRTLASGAGTVDFLYTPEPAECGTWVTITGSCSSCETASSLAVAVIKVIFDHPEINYIPEGGIIEIICLSR